MKDLLYKMFEHKSLSREESRRVLLNIADGRYNDAQLSAFMTVFLMRSITQDELSGFRDAVLERRNPVNLDDYEAIDIVGTGGDGKNTFNISTATCFVVAGSGRKVVKHGNFGASSVSGASNVMMQHGVKFTNDNDLLRRSLDESGVAYLHAPLFNPALKSVGPVRKALAVRTFFNMLGPLVNPVMPKYQLLGVYNLKLLRLYDYIARQQGVNCTVVHSLDGYDEISLTSPFKVASADGERLMDASMLGLSQVRQSDLYGGDSVEEASAIFDRVLAGRGSKEQADCVIANAAFALKTLEPAMSLADAVATARESLESGRALEAFRRFVTVNS
ncbi:MAG: anthranilate phosphoribosyltransferase [Candidatus Amulumruptor caecigallinarius]|uniref:Anthranilate phosphoribosyltransferase n=1 Tax=Candidatus Amulumruptor caecigallinarius TaxID=2109911 RepID=A0A4Q0UAV9_9BACT|nr:MAG: anthranilate phosphoribosyltransferase [Candidatus Amulumruptor caecigallinarius]HJE39469.1 anthranilate phosphoribosyltransferase [Candidatus Amulumruptor caecigallinarius]